MNKSLIATLHSYLHYLSVEINYLKKTDSLPLDRRKYQDEQIFRFQKIRDHYQRADVQT